ncbi:hypothetical protein ACJMK2_041869 [Sinanodonta woodiana]|uniref:TGF-beta family profile domain-containing protein n=1 Tax=Sinanodonta woodiana TaxID=1069815 RepID=A0ABD3W6Y1_SINWO
MAFLSLAVLTCIVANYFVCCYDKVHVKPLKVDKDKHNDEAGRLRSKFQNLEQRKDFETKDKYDDRRKRMHATSEEESQLLDSNTGTIPASDNIDTTASNTYDVDMNHDSLYADLDIPDINVAENTSSIDDVDYGEADSGAAQSRSSGASGYNDSTVKENFNRVENNSETGNFQGETNEKTNSVANETGQANLRECRNCDNAEGQDEFKTSVVKYQILKKLMLSKVPELKKGEEPVIPFDFYLGNFSRDEEKPEEETEAELYYAKAKQILVFGQDVTHKCVHKKSTGCYTFKIDDKNIDPSTVSAVYLWIYKQADLNDHYIQTFMVSELDMTYDINGNRTLRNRNIVKRLETSLKYGWMKIYVRRTVVRWLQKPARNKGLSVICKTCQRQSYKTIFGFKEGHKPILVFDIQEKRHFQARSKREVTCIGGNCCRRESLNINFEAIGWNFILYPKSINTYYCTGSCEGVLAAHYNHTKVVQALRYNSPDYTGEDLQPCCSPVAWLRPQSLLYQDNEGAVRKADVPDLIVGACGCT